jgi:hypothetical protein
MPINIVDAEYSRLTKVARAGRSRSKETLQLIKAIEELAPGKAKALVAERGEDTAKLKARLLYAARAADAKLKVAVDDGRVIFALKKSAVGKSRAGASERKRQVQQKALQMGKGSRKPISAEDVLAALGADGVKFNVARPATMAGAVLRSMPEFERTGRNMFKYKG